MRFLNRYDGFSFYWRIVVAPYRFQVAAISALILFGAALEMVTIGLAVPILDAATNENSLSTSRVTKSAGDVLTYLGIPARPDTVLVALLSLGIVLFLLRGFVTLLHQFCTSAIGFRLRRQTRSALFTKFVKGRFEDISARGRGTILNDIMSPPELLYHTIVEMGNFCAGIFQTLLLIGLMFYLSWWASLLLGILALTSAYTSRRLIANRAANYGRALYELDGAKIRAEVDAIDGFKVVKAYGLETEVIQRQKKLLQKEASPELRLSLLGKAPTLVNEILGGLIVLGLSVVTLLMPSLGMTFPMLAAFFVAIQRINPALGSINAAGAKISRAKRGLEVVEEVLYEIAQEHTPEGHLSVSAVREIQLSNVSFTYQSRPGNSVLKDVNLTLTRGTTTAVVGSTGSGKSTIANLMIGLFDPTSGFVLVNGIDLRRLDLRVWRQKIGYVYQDVFLFNCTIRENITLWDDSVTDSDIEWAAQVAHIHDFIRTLPDGYQTVVGDRGVQLSGGQCQRLAIARAVLRRPEVFIFDEATSNLDTESEEQIRRSIQDIAKSATVMIIAHRLSTIVNADWVYVLHDGRIVEKGTYAGLIGQEGHFSRLVHAQALTTG